MTKIRFILCVLFTLFLSLTAHYQLGYRLKLHV